MNIKLLTLAVAAVAMTGLAACESRPTDKAPGTYKTTTKSTNAAGTTTTSKKTTEVEVDQYGNKKAVVEKETTKDPEGLFNKSKSTSKTTYQD